MIAAALYVDHNSIYRKIEGVDCWDEDRDARKYEGNLPVIAHPPCRLWGKLRGLSTAPQEEMLLGYHAIRMVLEHGGILEHPLCSKIWELVPLDIGCPFDTRLLDWGFKATKLTRLWVVGLSAKDWPDIPLRLVMPTHCVTSVYRNYRKRRRSPLKELSKKARGSTPKAMAEWCVEVCRRIGAT